MIVCRLCNKPTDKHGTRLCDPCWELEHRVLSNKELARKILDKETERQLGRLSLKVTECDKNGRKAGFAEIEEFLRMSGLWRNTN